MGLTKAQAAGLADTSVSAGSYGSATAIPAITVCLLYTSPSPRD